MTLTTWPAVHGWNRCCDDFAAALELGTDSEMDGAAIVLWSDGLLLIGSLDVPVRFCPFCGVKVERAGEPS